MTKMNWPASVDGLMENCAAAIRAVVPFADRVKMSWKQPEAYDDWDEICEAIFGSLVHRSIEHSVGWEGAKPLIAYDMRVGSYADFSFLCVGGNPKRPFVCFSTKVSPFDIATFNEIDDHLNVVGQGELPLEGCNFGVVRRVGDASVLIKELEVVL
jgi:hypothetical protein